MPPHNAIDVSRHLDVNGRRAIAQGVDPAPAARCRPAVGPLGRMPAMVRAGKTDARDRLLLGISPRKVHNHLEKAKPLLNTPNRAVAARGLEQGLAHVGMDGRTARKPSAPQKGRESSGEGRSLGLVLAVSTMHARQLRDLSPQRRFPPRRCSRPIPYRGGSCHRGGHEPRTSPLA